MLFKEPIGVPSRDKMAGKGGLLHSLGGGGRPLPADSKFLSQRRSYKELCCMSLYESAGRPKVTNVEQMAASPRLRPSRVGRLQPENAPATGGAGTSEEDCRRQPAGRSRREAASQSGAATTSASVIGTPCDVATSILLRLDAFKPVQKLCEYLQVSPATLKLLFHRKSKGSPFNGFQKLKFAQAKRLLQERDTSIKSVALTLGYQHPNHFSRAFAAYTGTPPKQARAQPKMANKPELPGK